MLGTGWVLLSQGGAFFLRVVCSTRGKYKRVGARLNYVGLLAVGWAKAGRRGDVFVASSVAVWKC